jgi:uncharacterized membrane protein
LVYGVVAIVAGLDKFTYFLTDWREYLSPVVLQIMPFSATNMMYLVGVIEISVGVLVLTKLTRVAAYVLCAWLVAIALNLVMTGRYFDIAVRDLVMATGAFVLAKLTAVREGAVYGEKRVSIRPGAFTGREAYR